MNRKIIAPIAIVVMACIGMGVAPFVIHSLQDSEGTAGIDKIMGNVIDSLCDTTMDTVQDTASRDLMAECLRSEGFMAFETTLSESNHPQVIVYADMSKAYIFEKKTCFNGGLISLDGADLDVYLGEVVDLDGYSFSIMNTLRHEDVRDHAAVYECYLKFNLVSNTLTHEYVPLVASSGDEEAYRSEVLGIMDMSRGSLYSYDLGRFLFDDSGAGKPLHLQLHPLVRSMDFDSIRDNIATLANESLENLVYLDIATTVSCASGAIAAYLSSLNEATVTVGDHTYVVSELETIASELDDDHALVLADTLKIELALEPPVVVSDFVRFLTGIGCAVAVAASVALSFIPAVGPFLGAAVIGASTEIFMSTVLSGNVPDLGRTLMSAVVGALCVIPGVGLIGGSIIGGLGEGLLAALNGASVGEALTAFAIGSAMGLLLGGLAKGASTLTHKIGGGHVTTVAAKEKIVPVEDITPRSKAAAEVIEKNTPATKTKSAETPDFDPVREPAKFETYKREIYGYQKVEELPSVKVLSNFEHGIGKWSGEPGNSVFILEKSHHTYKQLREIFDAYGVKGDGIRYVNGNPSFGSFAKLRINGDIIDTSVVIPDMKPDIKVKLPDGRIKTISGRDFNQAYKNTNNHAWDVPVLDSDSSNYYQADRALAAKIGATADQVRAMRETNGLTWHEVSDGLTMELIPTAVHDAFKHCGGVSQMKGFYNSGQIERDFQSIIQMKFKEGGELVGF